MSQGVTGGLDLTVETLEFIRENFEDSASDFEQATDSEGDVIWPDPILRNHVTKTLYPSGETSGYTAQLSRNAYVVTVEWEGDIRDPVGTEFDFDVEAEVDVRIESVNNGFNDVIEDSTHWEALKAIIERAILRERTYPVTDPACRYDWRWLSVTNTSTLPNAEDNRDYYGTEFTVRWHGFERLP